VDWIEDDSSVDIMILDDPTEEVEQQIVKNLGHWVDEVYTQRTEECEFEKHERPR